GPAVDFSIVVLGRIGPIPETEIQTVRVDQVDLIGDRRLDANVVGQGTVGQIPEFHSLVLKVDTVAIVEDAVNAGAEITCLTAKAGHVEGAIECENAVCNLEEGVVHT